MYGTRYETTIKNHTGDVFGIYIEKLNYSGSTTHISRGGKINIDYKGGRQNTLDNIHPSICRLQLWAEEKYPNGMSGSETFQELLESQYKEFRVTITKNDNTLSGILSGQNIGSGVDWVTTGATILLNDDQDSKDLAFDFDGGLINIPYRVSYNYDVTTNVSATTMQSVFNWTPTGSYTGTTEASWHRNSFNNRWQSLFVSTPGHSNRLRGDIYYAAPSTDYTFVFKLAIANNLHAFGFYNYFIFRLWAIDDTLIDTVVQGYDVQGNKTLTVPFNSNAKVPGYITVEVEHRVGAGGHFNGSPNPGTIGDYWIYDAGTVLTGLTSGSTAGNVYIKILDENFNVLDSQKTHVGLFFNSWNGSGNYAGEIELTSTTVPPMYVSIEVEQASGDPTRITLNELRVVSASNENLYWRGWVKPELISTRYITDCFLISLDCQDGLNDLKEIAFPATGTTSSFKRLIESIKTCLEGTEIPLPIASQINLSNDEIDGNTIAQLYHSGSRFKDAKNGKIEYVKRFSALNMILNTFGAHLKQQNGYWQITQRNEVQSENYIFDWETLGDVGQETRNRLIDINDEKIVFESDELSKIAPLRFANIDINNAYTGDNFIFNGDFTEGLTGWQNSTGSTAIYSLTQGSTGDHIQAVNVGFLGHNPNVNRYFEYTIPFDFAVTTGDTVLFSLDAKAYSEVTGTTNPVFNPHYLIDFIDTSTNTTAWYSATNYMHGGGWRNYEHVYKVNFEGTLRLRVWIMPTYSSSSGNFSLTDCAFDNFFLSIKFKNTNAFNQYRQVTNVDTTAIANYQATQYFSDTFTHLERASLKYSLTGQTSPSWRNVDMTVTGHNITDLYLKELMIQHNTFKDFVTMNIRSLNDDIDFDSVLSVKGKKYYVAQLSKDLIQNLYDVQLVQRLENQTPNLVFVNGTYENGSNSSTSNGGSSSGGGASVDPVIYYPGQNITIIDNVISAIIPPIAISGISLTDYTLKSNFNTYTGTTAPSIYLGKSLFNTYTGATNTRISTIESNYVTGSTNGLTKSGKRLQLGGTLNNSTTLQGNSGTISFNFGGNSSNPNRLQTFRVFAHDEINLQLSGTQFFRFTTGYTQLYIPDQGTGRGIMYFNDLNHLKRLPTNNSFEGQVLTVSNLLPAYTGITYLDHYRRQRQKTVSTNSYNVRPHDNNYVIYCTHTGTTTIKLGSALDSGTTVCFVRMGGPVVFSATGASTYDGYSNTIYVQKGSAVVTKKTSVQWFGSGALASGSTGGGSLTGFTVSNGLTLSGSNIKLGGELTENTSITKGSQDFNFTDDGIIINCEEFFIDSVEGSSITSDEFVTIGQQVGIGTTELYLRGGKFELAFRSVTAGGGLRALFTDNRTGSTKVGIEYAADYSANFATNSLVTKKYVYGLSGITNNNISIDFVNNRIRFLNVPTSSAGLPSGTIWKDGSGFLKIV